MPNDREITQQEQTNAPIESTSFKKKSRLRLFLIGKRKLMIFFILAIFLIAAGLGYSGYRKMTKSKIIFTINGRKYTRADYQAAAAKAQDDKQPDKSEQYYLELKKWQYLAEQNSIVVSDGLLTKLIKGQEESDKNKSVKQFSELTFEEQSIIFKQAFFNAASVAAAGSFEGTVFVFPFARHITDYEGNLNKDPSKSKKVGIISAYDPALVELDKNYARSQAEYYLGEVKSSKLDEKTALEKIHADSKLDNVNSSNESVSFSQDEEANWQDKIILSDVKDFVVKQNTTTTSDIQVGKQQVNRDGRLEKVEAYFYFVKMKRTEPSKISLKNDQIVSQLDGQFKQLKVVTYDKK